MNPKYLLAAALLTAPVAARAGADELDAKLKDSAKAVLGYLKKHDCKDVGVLKFRVDKGNGVLADNVGALNNGIADRLEVALVLALPNDDIGIAYRASDVAAKIAGANHLTPAGRRAFFGRKYKLAWGDEEVEPTHFLTGTVVISKDLKTTTVTIEAFDKEGKMEKVTEFPVDTPLRVLADTGRSYLLTKEAYPDLFARGLKKEDVKTAVVEQTVTLDNNPPPVNPPKPPVKISLDKDAPIAVSVLVNGQKVEVTNGAIPEPKVSDKVEVLLENRSDAVHGVVLKVNGENTIFRERFDAKDCYKWILKPGEKIYVTGFQETNDKRNEFRVLSYEETKANEVNYGPQMGTIQVTAFRGKLTDGSAKPTPPTTPVAKDEDLVVAAISRGAINFNDDGSNPAEARTNTLEALKGKLEAREKKPTNSRGMLGVGNQTDAAVKKVTFEADPTEAVMNYTIKYYQPKK